MTPAWTLALDGEDVTARLKPHLASIRVQTTTDRTTDSLEIECAEGAPLAAPPTGRKLRPSLGYEGRPLVPMGEFWHTETELELVPRRIRIRATGADFRPQSGIRAPRTRAWHDTTLGAIVEEIAAEHGLTPRVDAALGANAIAHADQTAESDLHLMQRIARHWNGTAKEVGPDLVLAAAGAAASASGVAMPAVRLTPQSGITSGRVEYRDRPRFAAVRAPYRDLATAETLFAVAGAGEPAFDLPATSPDEPQAKAAAHAHLEQLRREGASLSATMPGRPELSAGCAIATRGWGPVVDGDWIAKSVTDGWCRPREYPCNCAGLTSFCMCTTWPP